MKSKYLKLIFLVSALMLFTGVNAETVSQKQAQQRAQQFFNEAAGRVMAPCKLIYNGKKLTTGRLFSPFYVYNQPTGGFVIISAENKAFPILGFSLKDNFDPEKLGETELELLRSYAQEIEYIRYDSQTASEAEEAWINYPQYVNDILKAPYLATDPIFSIAEADQLVETALESDNAVFSDIYTPEQWQDMILEEMQSNKSVPVWLIGNKSVFPMIVYGHQGDYFRLEMTEKNNWLMRLNATELIPSNMLSVINYPLLLNELEEEDIPFADYDRFAREVAEIEVNRLAAPGPDIMTFTEQPVVRSLGSGYFDVIAPQDITVAKIYNLAGALVGIRTYSNTNVAHIDLVSEPQGFYFVNLIGADGTPYGVKLYR